MWLLFAFLSAIAAAGVAIFAKLGLQTIDSTLATTVRSVIMAGFLVIVSFLLKKFDGFSLTSFSSREWILIALAGIAGALSWLFYFFALKQGFAFQGGGGCPVCFFFFAAGGGVCGGGGGALAG